MNINIVISIILGLGLASILRPACGGDDCIIVKGPSLKEISKQIYKIDDKCYSYKPLATHCAGDSAK